MEIMVYLVFYEFEINTIELIIFKYFNKEE
jgi:hypothetical protein